MQLRSTIIIPARLNSTRLPRKLLLRETGKSVIQHTYEAARRATRPMRVCVATDHEEIVQEVRRFGGNVEMTDPAAISGTDRVAELARKLTDVDVLVNVQGDEPDIAGDVIDLAIKMLEDHPDAAMSTIATPIRSREQLDDPACVKVVFDERGRALYFSRSAIPHAREWDDSLLEADPPHFYQHVGLYAYRRDLLLRLDELPRTHLEKLENLEQLRFLSAGHIILVGVVAESATGIDTADDYQAFVRRAA